MKALKQLWAIYSKPKNRRSLLAKTKITNICDRTPQVRDAILKELETDDCAAVDNDAMAGVVRLKVERLTSLKTDDFAGLDNLRVLNLREESQLTTLPDGVFDGLGNLVYLDLGGPFFRYVRNQGMIFVNGNQLTILPAGVFDELGNLRMLSLNGNQLTTLPDGVFDKLSSLRLLNLQENHLVGLTRDAPLFDRLTAYIDLGNQTEPPTPPELTDICD